MNMQAGRRTPRPRLRISAAPDNATRAGAFYTLRPATGGSPAGEAR